MDVWPFVGVYVLWAAFVLWWLFTHGTSSFYIIQLGTYAVIALHVSGGSASVLASFQVLNFSVAVSDGSNVVVSGSDGSRGCVEHQLEGAVAVPDGADS